MFVDNEQFNENYRGYNPAFVRRVREKQKAERQMQAMERRRQAAEEAKLQREVARVKAMQEAARQLAEERAGEDEARARVTAILSQYREVEQTKGKKSVRQIILETAIKHGVTEGEILGPLRNKKIVAARHEAMYRARKERPDLSLPQLGRVFKRDHSSICHAISKRH